MTNPASWAYLDVAVTQVQTWISRSPRLRLRRGASFLLAASTSQSAAACWLADPWVWNDEAGEISGVIALKRPTEAATDDELRESCLQLARRAVDHLACRTHYALITVDWGVGASYVLAHDDMLRRRATADLLLEPLPMPDESIVSRPCDGCGTHAVTASYSIHRDEPEQWVCSECLARHESAGYMSSHKLESWPNSMRDLYEKLAGDDCEPLGSNWFPDDFSQLAQAWSLSKDTQLATIYADGNRVGAALDALIDTTVTALSDCSEASPGCPVAAQLVKADLVKAVDASTKEALASAVRGALPSQAKGQPGQVWWPVIVHVAAGDDIIVSVPARFCWRFVQCLSDAFRHNAATQLHRRVCDAGVDPDHPCLQPFLSSGLSLGIGVVFHHLSHPIDDVITKAAAEMRTAKLAGRGRAPTVCFLDLTADGEQRPTGERVWQLGESQPGDHLPSMLEQSVREVLHGFAGLDTAARHTLLTLVREALADPNPEHASAVQTMSRSTGSSPERAWQALERRIETMRHHIVRRIYPPHESPPSNDELHRLRRYLDTARWWPTTNADAVRPATSGTAAGMVRR